MTAVEARPATDTPALGTPRDDAAPGQAFTVDPALLGLSGETRRARLLDVGCGAGRHELATVRLPVRTVGCDVDRKVLNDGRLFVDTEAPGLSRERVTWGLASGSLLPFRDGTFDAAICSETLEHVEDDVRVLRELRRAVRRGGRLAVSVPAYLVELLMWQLSWEVTHTPGGHIRIYERGELLRKLRLTGWQPYAVRRRHGTESVYWLLGALGGGGEPPPAVARWWRAFVNHPAVRERAGGRALERALTAVAPKSLVVYAQAV